uniref:CZB domain-containing protein n=2 Tax=Candidatus Electrothrix sp. TaxID=2170559 RepID=UPI00405639E9
MDVMNLQTGMIAHLQWKSKLSDFFYGVEELTLADVPDHNSCDFGKLFNRSIKQEYSDFNEISAIDVLHKEIHEDIKRLIQLPVETRKSAEGKQALETFKKKCDRFVEMLERLEAEAKRR